VRNGIPIAIDFCNPAPDADIHSVGQDNFDWVVESAANMAIARAKNQIPGQDNLTWGSYIRNSAMGLPLGGPVSVEEKLKKAPAKAATKTTKKK
jgi:hypothetical protein